MAQGECEQEEKRRTISATGEEARRAAVAAARSGCGRVRGGSTIWDLYSGARVSRKYGSRLPAVTCLLWAGPKVELGLGPSNFIELRLGHPLLTLPSY